MLQLHGQMYLYTEPVDILLLVSTEESVASDQSAVREASGDSELLYATGGKDVDVQDTVGLHQMLQSLAQGQVRGRSSC